MSRQGRRGQVSFGNVSWVKVSFGMAGELCHVPVSRGLL
jgi:hypothetical protein